MIQTILTERNTLDEMLADLAETGREYWQFEAQFSPCYAIISITES